MAFRFRRSFRLAPGVRLNLSRSGVSTTVGGRGFSVNSGRRGTYINTGIPGTGIHARSRVGGGRGRGRGAGAGGAGQSAAGCGGCAGVAMLLLVFVGFCGTIAGNHGGGSGSPSLVTVDTTSTADQPHETLYAHGAMNIRAGAGTNFRVVRTVARGERLEIGPKDATGWASVYEGYGDRIGYVYRASPNLRTRAPRSTAARPRRPRTPTHPAGASAICRDGSYSYSAHRRGTCSWHGGVAQWL